MAAFAPGDRVHVPRLGTGTILDVRSGNRFVVEIKGKTLVVEGAQLERAEPPRTRKARGARGAAADEPATNLSAAPSLDLHGKTVDEAVAALDEFLDAALLASHAEVRVIHGRSGGRLRDAVHARLRQLPPVRAFRIDPRNPGVTIVSL